MANEKPCIYKHTCGWEICMMSDCPEYVPKTKGRKWFEEEDEDEQMWKCVYSAEFDDDISEWFGFYEFNEGEHFCSRGERKDNE